jgi:hypothetical protein
MGLTGEANEEMLVADNCRRRSKRREENMLPVLKMKD